MDQHPYAYQEPPVEHQKASAKAPSIWLIVIGSFFAAGWVYDLVNSGSLQGALMPALYLTAGILGLHAINKAGYTISIILQILTLIINGIVFVYGLIVVIAGIVLASSATSCTGDYCNSVTSDPAIAEGAAQAEAATQAFGAVFIIVGVLIALFYLALFIGGIFIVLSFFRALKHLH